MRGFRRPRRSGEGAPAGPATQAGSGEGGSEEQQPVTSAVSKPEDSASAPDERAPAAPGNETPGSASSGGPVDGGDPAAGAEGGQPERSPGVGPPPAATAAEPVIGGRSEVASGDIAISKPLEERLTSLEAGVHKVLEEVGKVREEFDAKLRYDKTKQQAIDSLHEENQKYKRDLVGKAVRPLVLAVLRFQTEMGKQADAWRKEPGDHTSDKNKALKLLQGFEEDVEVLLENFGLKSYRGTPRESFDARRQRVLSVIPTPDRKMDRLVHECVRPGFEWDGQIVETEGVNVYRFEKPKAESSGTDA